MVTYSIYMKELSSTSSWQDITHAVAVDKIPIRKGFGSLSDAVDMGSVSMDIHMESLESAALLHVSRKQVLIQKDGVTIFEGISYDDASVDLQNTTDYVFVSIKFKPYSSLFEQAKVPEDTVYTDVKICDPADPGKSLVHMLINMIIANLPGEIPSILSGSITIATSITNTKTLPIVLLEKGESVEEYLTDLLYQNGYAYYMDLFSIVVVDPFRASRVEDRVVDIKSLVESPSISQEPYIKEKKAVVRFPRVEQYDEEVVYELNDDRETIDGSASQVEVLEPGDYYPLDEEEPAELEAEYETDRETDDIEFVYVLDPRLDVLTRKEDPAGGESTLPAYITVSKIELTPTGATVQLYNQLSEKVSLRNIRVIAGTAYYRNWASIYEDDDTDATETEEIDGLYMPDKATAQDFIRRYRMEINAEKTPVTFESSILLAPNTLISIPELPYKLLIRSVTDYNDQSDVYEYEAVAYSVLTVSVGTRIRVSGQGKPQDGRSPVPVRLYALGTANGPYESSVTVSDDSKNVRDDLRTLGIDAAWKMTRPTPGEGEYVWYVIGYYTPPEKWPTEWTIPVKDTGLNAYSLQLSAPEGTVINMSGGGVLKTTSLKFTAVLSNILPTSIVWSVSNGTLNTVVGDAYSRTLDCSTVSQDNVTITITATIGGATYSASIGVQRLFATRIPANLHTVTSLPVSVEGDPLENGDYFIVGENFSSGGTNYLKGQIWEYQNNAWVISTDTSKAMSLLGDFADLEVDVESTVIGNAVIKSLVALQAVVQNLYAQNLEIGEGDGTSGSGFRYRAMQDRDRNGSMVPVVDVYDGADKIFEIDPVSRNISIGDYANNNGLQWNHTERRFYIRGNVNADSGTIKGQLDTITLQTLLGGDTEYPKGNMTTIESLVTAMVSHGVFETDQKATGTINGKSIKFARTTDITIAYAQRYTSAEVLWETWYKYASAIICTVGIVFTMTDNTTIAFAIRKIEANIGRNEYPEYPTPPATLSQLFAMSDFQNHDDWSDKVPNPPNQSAYDDILPLRAFPYTVYSLSLYDSTQERFYIKNLPTNPPAESERIWNDSGTLKIVP